MPRKTAMRSSFDGECVGRTHSGHQSTSSREHAPAWRMWPHGSTLARSALRNGWLQLTHLNGFPAAARSAICSSVKTCDWKSASVVVVLVAAAVEGWTEDDDVVVPSAGKTMVLLLTDAGDAAVDDASARRLNATEVMLSIFPARRSAPALTALTYAVRAARKRTACRRVAWSMDALRSASLPNCETSLSSVAESNPKRRCSSCRSNSRWRELFTPGSGRYSQRLMTASCRLLFSAPTTFAAAMPDTWKDRAKVSCQSHNEPPRIGLPSHVRPTAFVAATAAHAMAP
mmetsp:Transcript_48623/g.150130  ORF Transcript_48623/g.150130 Transcript_48623/m.150130 type:complete len:287 (-) Transcript_48623:724-1584(-)